jgi:hypothetical protein
VGHRDHLLGGQDVPRRPVPAAAPDKRDSLEAVTGEEMGA